MSNDRSSKPFKMIDCTRRGFLRMPGNALKIWLYYYTREGKERLAWASEEELCAATGLNRDVMYDWRNWLEDNGWLKKMGTKQHGDGRFAMAVFRVKEGTIPEKEDKRRSNRVRKSPTGSPVGENRTRSVGENQSPSSRGKSESDQSVKIGEEVEPKKQVDSQKQVEPLEVGVSESVSELVSEAAPPPPSCLACQTQTPETLTPQVGEAEEEEKTKPCSRYADLNPEAQIVVMNLHPGWIPGDLGVDAAQLNSVAAQQTASGLDWNEFFAWHRTHKPPKLIFRNAAKFLAAWEYAVNDYAAHDPKTCAVCLKLGKQQQHPHDTFVRCGGCGGYASPKYKNEDFCEKCYPKYSRAAAGLPLIADKPCACGDKRGEGHIGFCTAEA